MHSAKLWRVSKCNEIWALNTKLRLENKLYFWGTNLKNVYVNKRLRKIEIT